MKITTTEINKAAESIIEDIEEIIRDRAEEITETNNERDSFDEVVINYERILKAIKKQL
jgi:BioD-like phosphotransacetylase family protein